MPGVAAPRLVVAVDGSAVERWVGVTATSTAEGVRASLSLSRIAERFTVDQVVTIELGDALVARAPIHRIRDMRRRTVRYLVESKASRSLRGAVDDDVGPLSRHDADSRELASAVLDGLDANVDALPQVRLRWSTPAAPRRQALASLLASISAAADKAVVTQVLPDGTVALGAHEDLRTPSGVTLRAGESVLQRRGKEYVARAVPVAYNQTVTVDGEELACVHARLDVSAGYHASRLVLEAAS